MSQYKAAPGATIPVNEIYGRDPLIASLWTILERSSIRLEAERRIGKTCILRKMKAEPPQNWEVVLLDVEKIHSASEFAERIYLEVQGRLEGWKKQGRRLQRFFEAMGGAQVATVKLPEKKDQGPGYWKTLLVSAVEDLIEQQEAVGKRTVFLLDEMPWMLDAIADPGRDGAQTAMEVLDVLRSLRQSETTGQGFRMVLCGSIGLHHVLATFKRKGYKNRPVNDMRLVEVMPLDLPVATRLATLLLDGDGMAREENTAARIAEQTGGFPYYIHWVVSTLQSGSGQVTGARVDLALRELLTASHDPCDFRHFRDRIAGYYPDEEKIVLTVLDHAAASTNAISPSELLNVAKSAGATDENRVRELLETLSMDHYLRREVDGRYVFRHVLLRRWWRLERGLGE